MTRIVVCIKQVAYLYSRMGIDDRENIDPKGVVWIVNPYDEIALEEALRIKDGMDGAEVTLMSFGPPKAEEVLRYGLAMGADQAIHICAQGPENIGPFERSRVLVGVIEKQAFDLILCGKKAIDDNEGIVGCFMAERLGLPFVSSVTGITLLRKDKKVRMSKMLERGDQQVLECNLPALLSVEKGLIKPRYPTLRRRLIASQKEIIKVEPLETMTSLGEAEPGRVVKTKLSISRPKPKKIFTPDSSLSAEDRIKLIMSGGLVEKKRGSLKGSPQALAEQFVHFLAENRIIRRHQSRQGQGRT